MWSTKGCVFLTLAKAQEEGEDDPDQSKTFKTGTKLSSPQTPKALDDP